MQLPSHVPKWLPLAFASVLLLLGSSVATAGQEEARKYFKQAKQAYADEEYERAASLLEKAYSEEANLTYQYNRIRALQGAKRYREALEVLKTYEQPMLDAKGFEDIPKIKESLEKKVDDPGSSSAADADQSDDESKEAQSTNTSPDQTDTGGSSSGAGLAPLGWALAGTGVASLGTGTLFGSTALLPDSPDASTIRTHQTATAIFLAAGGASLVAGGIILYNEVFSAEAAGSSDRSAPRIRVRPYAGPDGAGAVLDVRF